MRGNKLKLLIVMGTRPEAIKMAPVYGRLKNDTRFDVRCCVTAQHRGMLDQVLELFGIKPEHDLDLMSPGQDLTDVTIRVLDGLRRVLKEERPDWVLVHGDTTTSMAASLAAYYERIRVGHVEAGLRTGDKFAPFPEEINRTLTGRLADLHFAPTVSARENLLREGAVPASIYVTGNTVIDALLQISGKIDAGGAVLRNLDGKFPYLNSPKNTVLVTAHRRESFGSGFENICRAIADLAKRPDVQFVFPVHPNPNVTAPVGRYLTGKDGVFLIEPQAYLEFVYLMKKSRFILTDSGGIQEEAPSLGKPVLVMRDLTERPEAVQAGVVKMVGANFERITSECCRLLEDGAAYEKMSRNVNPYGDGKAAERIGDIFEKLVDTKLMRPA